MKNLSSIFDNYNTPKLKGPQRLGPKCAVDGMNAQSRMRDSGHETAES